jgi:hypothetical protein
LCNSLGITIDTFKRDYVIALRRKVSSVNAPELDSNNYLLIDFILKYTDVNEYNRQMEHNWNFLCAKYETGIMSKCLAVCDTSESMKFPPYFINISVVFGILTARLNKTEQLINFSCLPSVIDMRDGTLFNKIQKIYKIQWGYSLDFNELYKVILDKNIQYVLIITDMEFRKCKNNDYNARKRFKEMLRKTNHPSIQFIYWNLSAINEIFPLVMDTNDDIFINGTDRSLINYLLTTPNITPLGKIDYIFKNYN